MSAQVSLLGAHSRRLVLWVNGKRHTVHANSVEVRLTLLEYLRKICLMGTKKACGSGNCGACTVIVSRMEDGVPRHRTVNACIMPLCLVAGAHVTTVEGVGDNANPHVVQSRLAELHGSQCGFCTPGFVVSLYAALCQQRRDAEGPTTEQMEDALAGNLCRCTGYRPILDVAKSLSGDCGNPTEEHCVSTCGEASGDIEDAASLGKWGQAVRAQKTAGAWHLSSTDDKLKALSGSCAVRASITLPPELVQNEGSSEGGGREEDVVDQFSNDGAVWLRPRTLAQLARLRTMYSESIVIGGETDFSANRRARSNVFIDITGVPQLQIVSVPSSASEASGALITLGGAVVVARALEALEAALLVDDSSVDTSSAAASRRALLMALKEALSRMGTMQNRNSMALGSHLGAQDLSPVLCALGVHVETTDEIGRLIPFAEWYSSPRAGVVVRVELPQQLNEEEEQQALDYAISLKAAPRRIGAIGTVSAAIRVRLVADRALQSWRVVSATLCFSLRGRLVVASSVASALRESNLRNVTEAFAVAAEALKTDLDESTDSLFGALASSLLFRALVATAEWIEGLPLLLLVVPAPVLDPRDRSATVSLKGTKPNSSPADLFGKHAATTLTMTTAADGSGGGGGGDGGIIHGGRLSSFGAQAWTKIDGRIQTSLGGDELRDSSGNTLKWQQGEGGVGPHAPDTFGPRGTGPGPREPVGTPYHHVAALQQTTGEAVYVADIEPPSGCLEASMVVSAHPHAKILSIDPSAALALEGVIGYFDHRDLADRSIKGKSRVEDDADRVFADGIVTCVGQAIGIIVAETKELADAAARLVQIEYEVLLPCLSIADAIAQNRFFDYDHCVANGDVEAALATAPRTLSGGLCVGAQEHFYLEPHALLAIPGETYGEMEIRSCTQCVTKSAHCAAGCLGVPEAKVRVVVKRLGGGFGGKETLSIYRSGAIAVAAAKTKRAVRFVLTREEDMAISGQSHPFDGRWTVGYDETGKITACDVQLINDGGCTVCCSDVVMDRGMSHFANAYDFGAVRVVGRLAWTHLPSNTAFRGFGVPQSATICEDMICCIAASLGLHPDAVRERNFMPDGGRTPYGQLVSPCHTPRIWQELRSTAQVDVRRASIAEFNKMHRWRKRGIATIPTCYGVNFPVKYLNQAGSHVLVYTDGTVLVSHAGVEMGQGLNTKVIQVAAQALGVPIQDVHIAETANDRVNNTSPTAASVGADLNGMATLNACEQIRQRLYPLFAEFPDKSFREICDIAYHRQIPLAAHGFYASPYGGVHKWRSMSKEEHLPSADRSLESNVTRGDIFNYFAFGAACAEIELDVLTGLFDVVRADVLMDVGDSLNPAIDIGQVEGAFVQGMGRFTMEEIRFEEGTGVMTSVSPHTYFLPTSLDVPKDFRVSLLGDAASPTCVHSSKAVGEPPFFLSSCVYFAIKDAVESFRRDEGGTAGHLRLNSPLTAGKIRLACRDGNVLR